MLLRDAAFILFAIILIFATIKKTISIPLSIIVFAVILVISQYDRVYQSWVVAKEQEAFEKRMGELVFMSHLAFPEGVLFALSCGLP